MEQLLDTMLAVADGLYPPPLGGSISPNQYISTLPGFREALEEGIDLHLSSFDVIKLKLLMGSLRSGVLTMALTGTPTMTSFESSPLEVRAEMLKDMAKSAVGKRREAFNSLKRFLLGTAMSYVDPKTKENPLWETLGYPGPPPPEEAVTGSFPFSKYTKSGSLAGETFDYVIVGSGSGGSTVAKTLAEGIPNVKILIIEKGNFLPDNLEEVSQVESEGMSKYYEKGSLLTTDDGSIMILAGAGLGGGSTINWGCCLDTPSYVRKEWATDFGIDWVDSPEFESCLDDVKKEMGVHADDVKHNSMNEKMIYGCKKNGFDWKVAPQNIKDTKRDSAGWTCFGPKQGNKQGGGITWLRDYCRTGNGTLFNGHAVSVTSNSVTLAPASSLHDRSTHFKVNVRHKVIVACGSLHTPLLLKRSGCRNKNIGNNLRLHPVSAIMACCEEEQHGYKGAPMTTVCTEFEKGVENNFYGPKLECPSVHTGVMAAALPWPGATKFKSILQNACNMVAVIVLQRDKGSGTVTGIGPGGYEPSINYNMDKGDGENILNGLEKAFDILSVNPGVNRIWACHPKQVAYEVDKADGTVDAEKAKAFKSSLRQNGVGVNELGLFCAHQMGSCRMASTSALGAVDEDGEVWEMDNVHVIDASIFPTASGANPMMTTMALSRGLAKRLVEVHNNTQKGQEIKRKRAERRGKEGAGISNISMFVVAAAVGFAATYISKHGLPF
mmetsp:Transcript_1236/g.2224  ORF Transcript_1236/g.2224 Transcript_1236/m.2224 type:complete len:723 (-) Transcript_1236:32-2200(-)